MKPFRASTLVITGVLLLLIGMGWFMLRKPAGSKAAPTRTPVAVEVAKAEARDVPIWLDGIGTVQANNTVTIRPRVSGALESVSFTEGHFVKAGEILALIDPRPYQAALDQALAKLAQDEARATNDRREFERVRDLVATQTESRQLLDQRNATLAQSTAQVQASRAAVDNARLELDFTAIRAPIDGLTGVRLIDAGNLVTANQNTGLVVITQTRPVAVVFTLPQQSLPDLRRGMVSADESPLAVEALDDEGRPLARGSLVLVDNQIDTSTGTLRLKASFPNDDQTLWPGQFVNARVLVQTLTAAVTVPAEAVKPGLNGPFVYVIKPDSTVEARTVVAGPTVDNLTVIFRGLDVGDRVVRVGQNKLKPGALISPASSAK